ncbi:MAG TPA: YkgJ family cysteine cluster protein [Kofleriaceae bacterium]|nr:YkgJ family cysteine cluster protein [Kofleriaceae bacterium]
MASKDAERARARAKQLVRERIDVARAAMAACEDAIGHELEALAARGVAPTCSKGCAHCCRQEILVTRAEAEAIVEWIEAAWPAERRAALAERIQGWLAWFRGECRARVAGGMAREVALYEHGPPCVALVDDACSIYPTRPMMCRMHFVRSTPDACRQKADPALVAEPVVTLPSIHRVTQPAVLRIRAEIERQGADFMSTVHLLPEWLAHLMKIEAQPWLDAPPAR